MWDLFPFGAAERCSKTGLSGSHHCFLGTPGILLLRLLFDVLWMVLCIEP